MSKTSVTIGEHFEGFIAGEIATGRYRTASEVMREALRLLEAQSNHRRSVVQALIEAEEGGSSDSTTDEIYREALEEAARDGII